MWFGLLFGVISAFWSVLGLYLVCYVFLFSSFLFLFLLFFSVVVFFVRVDMLLCFRSGSAVSVYVRYLMHVQVLCAFCRVSSLSLLVADRRASCVFCACCFLLSHTWRRVTDSLPEHPTGDGYGEGIPAAPAYRGAKGKRSGECVVLPVLYFASLVHGLICIHLSYIRSAGIALSWLVSSARKEFELSSFRICFV